MKNEEAKKFIFFYGSYKYNFYIKRKRNLSREQMWKNFSKIPTLSKDMAP